MAKLTTKDALFQALGQKLFGNYFETSEIDVKQTEFFNHAFKELASGLLECVLKSGMSTIPDTQEAITQLSGGSELASPLRQRNTVGGKIRSVYNKDPMGVIIWAGYLVKECMETRDSAEHKYECERKHREKVDNAVRESWTIRGLRKRLKVIENDYSMERWE